MNIDGKKLKAAREAKGLTQEALAELSGVSQETISRIENGKLPGGLAATQSKLSRALGIHETEFRTNEPAPSPPLMLAENRVKYGRSPVAESALVVAIGDAFTSTRWTIADRTAAEAASAALAAWAVEGMDIVALARDYLDAAKRLREHGESATPAAVNAQLAAIRSRVSPTVEAQLSRDANAQAEAEFQAFSSPTPKRKR